MWDGRPRPSDCRKRLGNWPNSRGPPRRRFRIEIKQAETGVGLVADFGVSSALSLFERHVTAWVGPIFWPKIVGCHVEEKPRTEDTVVTVELIQFGKFLLT